MDNMDGMDTTALSISSILSIPANAKHDTLSQGVRDKLAQAGARPLQP